MKGVLDRVVGAWRWAPPERWSGFWTDYLVYRGLFNALRNLKDDE